MRRETDFPQILVKEASERHLRGKGEASEQVVVNRTFHPSRVPLSPRRTETHLPTGCVYI